MKFLRSLVFWIWIALALMPTFVLGIVLLPLPRALLRLVSAFWVRIIFFGFKWIVGLHYEVRGAENIPKGRALVASKHFSIWETLAFLFLLPDPALVLKHELLRIPIYGWYTAKLRMIPIDRMSAGSAIRRMCRIARRAIAQDRPVVIFPEGRRTRPGALPDYKPGAAALYRDLALPCIPITHNSGLFWSGGFIKKPGKIVIEFLPAIPAGLSRPEFMDTLQTRIEEATNRLLAEGQG